MYRRGPRGLELLLVHPGGPFWAKKDRGAWSIPKGEYSPPEEPLAAAVREFEEELGARPSGSFQPLGELAQPSRKIVSAFAVQGDLDPRNLRGGTFALEWPPKSGRSLSFPEVDRAEWFSADEARERILVGQREFIARLEALVGR